MDCRTISSAQCLSIAAAFCGWALATASTFFAITSLRSEEHTSELQSHRDLHSFPTRRSSDLDGLSNDLVRSVLVDRSGVLWVGTRDGLNVFRDNEFTTYTTQDGLANNFIG